MWRSLWRPWWGRNALHSESISCGSVHTDAPGNGYLIIIGFFLMVLHISFIIKLPKQCTSQWGFHEWLTWNIESLEWRESCAKSPRNEDKWLLNFIFIMKKKIKTLEEKHTCLFMYRPAAICMCQFYVVFCSTVQWGGRMAVRRRYFLIGVQIENQPPILENYQHWDIPNDTIPPCKEPRVFPV